MSKALVLCGGGSKGGFQMGVWKAFRELGIENDFDIITSTSIGSLNGVMYLQNDYDKCLDLWNNISNEMIMTNPIQLKDLNIKQTLKSMDDLVNFARGYFQKKGVDISPFKNILNDYINYDKVKNSNIKFDVTTVTFPSFKPVFINVNELNIEEMKAAVLASASCFPLFPVCKFRDQNLIDGGYFDNLPIDHALDLGAKEVIAVDLNYAITHKEYLNKPNITYIYPSWSLGGFFYFEQEQIQANIILGYNDAMKAYNKLEGFRYTFNIDDIDDNLLDNFYHLVLKYDRMYRLSKQKSLVSLEEGSNIFKILEKYTYHPLTKKEYFIRALEVALEFFKVNHLNIYSYENVKSLILDRIYNVEIEDENILEKYNKIKSIKGKREYLLGLNKFDLLGSFLNLELTDDIILNLLLTRPKIILILLLHYCYLNDASLS